MEKKSLKPLTPKQKRFVQHILDNPKDSYTEAAMQAYNAKDRGVAQSIATENLLKPVIRSKLGLANDLIESTLETVVKEWGNSDKVGERGLAIDTAKFIHDKIHGKATQVVKQQSTSVNISISLDGS